MVQSSSLGSKSHSSGSIQREKEKRLAQKSSSRLGSSCSVEKIPLPNPNKSQNRREKKIDCHFRPNSVENSMMN